MTSELYPIVSSNLSPIGRNLLPFIPRIVMISDKSFSFKNDMLSLKDTMSSMILFHINNRESHDCINVFYSVAESVSGVVVGTCNLHNNNKLEKFLGSLSLSPSHPLSWLVIKQVPFILLFKGGWPVSYYNGVRSTGAILDYLHYFLMGKTKDEREPAGISVLPDVQVGMNNTKEIPITVVDVDETLRSVNGVKDTSLFEEDVVIERPLQDGEQVTSKMMLSQGSRVYTPQMFLIGKSEDDRGSNTSAKSKSVATMSTLSSLSGSLNLPKMNSESDELEIGEITLN